MYTYKALDFNNVLKVINAIIYTMHVESKYVYLNRNQKINKT